MSSDLRKQDFLKRSYRESQLSKVKLLTSKHTKRGSLKVVCSTLNTTN